MKKLAMKRSHDLTFEEGCHMYLDYCKARNLREGTIKHYKEILKSIYRYIEPTISINSFDKETMNNFIIDMKNNLDVKDTALYTYARDLKILMYFFMDKQLMETFKIRLMKVDKEPIECYSDNELSILLKKPNIKQCSFSEFKTWVIINFLLLTGIRMNSRKPQISYTYWDILL